MNASVDALSATIGATAKEEDKAADAGTIAAPASSAATSPVRTTSRSSLVRTASRIKLARVPGGSSLVRTVLRATLASLRYCHHQGERMTTIRMRGLGASNNLVSSPVSWVVLKPQPLSMSSSSFLVR